jgi:hypothetical protein
MLTECSKETRNAILGVFGQVGIALEKFLRSLHHIYLLQDLDGIFPPLTFNKKILQFPERSFDTQKDLIELFGSSLVDLICGKATLDPRSLSNNRPQSVFQGVSDDQLKIRQGFRLFLVFRTVSVSKLIICYLI